MALTPGSLGQHDRHSPVVGIFGVFGFALPPVGRRMRSTDGYLAGAGSLVGSSLLLLPGVRLSLIQAASQMASLPIATRLTRFLPSRAISSFSTDGRSGRSLPLVMIVAISCVLSPPG